MPRIELRENVDLPAALTGPEVLRVLRAIEAREGRFGDFALSVPLEDLHLPDAASVSVPLELTVTTAHGDRATPIEFEFGARHQHALFPVFTGSLRADAVGPGRCTLWFSGTYEPPLGAIGKALNATVLRGIAERTLGAFLTDVANAAAAAVRAREESHIRSAEFNS